MSNFPHIIISKFLGINASHNPLINKPDELLLNYNYLYSSAGGLYERGGGDKLTDPPAAGVIYGLGNYRTSENSIIYIFIPLKFIIRC
ncbi:unnamed protein product [marine sediment metagenome]|uniref:Uncharacterized protein n=1 Tax=marine sediment metagenome TaxID=412755 RepID=X1RZI7_9ZZZZ